MRIPIGCFANTVRDIIHYILNSQFPSNNRFVTLVYCSLAISVQHECIPQAVLGMDIICQAKSGMGKTAVFVLVSVFVKSLSRHYSTVLNKTFRRLYI